MNLDQYDESPVVPEGSRDLGQAVDIRARDGDGAVFSRVVRARHSVRQFKPDPVPLNVMRSVLADARFSPSNCNTQPWEVHVLSGKIRDAFSARMIVSADRGENSPDYSWAKTDYPDQCVQRYDEHGRIRHEAIGFVREDAEGRRRNDRRNLTLFDAPHVALLFMPAVGDSVRVAGDIGMYVSVNLNFPRHCRGVLLSDEPAHAAFDSAAVESDDRSAALSTEGRTKPGCVWLEPHNRESP